jgi:hypothetical protein
LGACDNSGKQYSSANDVVETETFNSADSTPAFQQAEPEQAHNTRGKQPNPAAVIKPDWDKKIVKTANVNLEVKDYKQYSRSLYEKAKQFGGYVSGENQSVSEYRIENAVTIRVPVEQFDNAVNALVEDGIKVNEKTITSEDVTTQFVDGRSRIEAKKQVRQRYLELLQNAKNMSEILEVQNHINSVQEEIETNNGRLNYLGNVSAMSSIQITYYQILNPAAVSDKDESFGKRVIAAFTNGFKWLGELFVTLLSIWPLLLLLSVCFYFFKRRFVSKAINKSV